MEPSNSSDTMEQRPQPGIQDSSNLTPTYDFAHISPAILELITHFLNGYDILALCMTCSKPLFARIRAGGAVRFSIGPTDVSAWSADGFGMLQLEMSELSSGAGVGLPPDFGLVPTPSGSPSVFGTGLPTPMRTPSGFFTSLLNQSSFLFYVHCRYQHSNWIISDTWEINCLLP